MKTLITTLNAKYIHKSLSLRLLYVTSKDQYDVSFKEYTIKDQAEHIVEDILASKVDVVAFSVYIWNVDFIKEICSMLKKKKDIVIILGGPEVSYDIDPFLDTFDIDYLISGQGEVSFPYLLGCIENKEIPTMVGISSKTNRSYEQCENVDLQYIETLDSPYVLEQDLESMSNRILYFETSRGCPYRCSYCLSSLEKGLSFYSMEYIQKQLDLIYETGVKTIKFLDRSFNAKTSHALGIIEHIIKKDRLDVACQFEINGDVLDQKIIDYMHEFAPAGMFRYEIGIQSTYNPTNKIVNRLQNFDRLKEVIIQLQDAKIIDLHLDLIAGLPLETKERFAQSFDDVFSFRPKELQLGFLKLLRGTSLRKEASDYGYSYQENAPYELIQGNDLSIQDIKDIHLAEDMLEKYWNSGKCKKTMNYIMDQIDSPFSFFYQLGCFYLENNYKTIHYQNDELFTYLYNFTKSMNLDVEDLLIEDYLSIFKVKPKRWWETKIENRKEIFHYLIDTYQLNKEVVFRYGMVEKVKDGYLLAIYKDMQGTVKKYQ